MPLPTDDLIVWASSDVNLPNLAGPNKVKPIDDLILKGWDFKQKPAADEFNYVLNNLGMHVSYLEESKTYTFSGDVTGTATSTGSDDVTFNVSVTDNSHNHISANISDATSLNKPNMVVRRDIDGSMAANYIRADAYFDGDLQGNANTASALQTARTISISGDGSGSVSFNGTSDISIPLVIANNSHNHISANISDATSSNAAFMIVKRDDSGNFSAGTVTAALSGNSSTATTLQTARTINGTSFNGSANITTNSWGTARTLTLAGAVTGSVSIDGARDVTLNTSVSSNSSTSTTLQTPRAINGTYFDGSSDITTDSWGYSRNLAFTGFATGNGYVDGSGNVSIELSMGSGFTNSKTTNGYTYLPNGILLQWGYASSVIEDGVSTITLPITFPNAAFSLSVTPVSNSGGLGGVDFSAHGKILSTSQIALAITSVSGAFPGAAGVYWLIIGH